MGREWRAAAALKEKEEEGGEEGSRMGVVPLSQRQGTELPLVHGQGHGGRRIRAVGDMEADRYGMGPEIRSLRLAASLSLTSSLKDEEEEEEEEEVEEEEEETVSSTPLEQGVPPVDPNLGEWNCYEQDFLAYFATWPKPQDGHPISYKEHHVLLTRVIGNVVNRALATFFLWKFFVKMPVPSQSGVTELPELLIGDDDVDTMAKVWAPFFDCAHISENTSFSAADRSGVFHPHLQGKLTRFPIEFFPLTTNSACFTEGNVAQTVRHFGFSETAANKIAWALDMVPTNVFSQTTASGVRKLWVRALPGPVNEHAYADRKRALQDSNGSQGAWPEASWQHAVESVLFVECQSKTWEVAAASPLGVVPWLEHNRPEVLAELRKVRSLCTGRLAHSKSLVPLGVADARYRTEVCQGIEDAETYSCPGLAFLLPTEDVHASPPKGGVNPAFATRCPRCKDLAGVNPCFRIFQSLHPNTHAMMPGPEWQILSYHVPGMSAFLPEVDDEDEARRRMYETARTMAAATKMRHRNPEAHVGDDEYILEDVKAAVDEATAGKTNEQEMRRVERINREGAAGAAGQRSANARRPGQRGANARRPGQRGANARRPGQRGANARRPGQRGANARRPGQRGANARRPGQRGANARRPGQRGANARRPGQRGANARRPGQRGANARRPGQRGANARRPGQRGANARRPGQRGANAPRPGQRGADARRPGQRGANARRPGQRGANARRPGQRGGNSLASLP
eukprot:jgi/Tetstr1/453725/TSEL_040681.t1